VDLSSLNRKFSALAERAIAVSGDNPAALEAVERDILLLAGEEERLAAQGILLRAQDAVRLRGVTTPGALNWIVGAKLHLAAPLSARDADSLLASVADALYGLENPVTKRALMQKGIEPRRPGAVLHTTRRCQASVRLWIGFHAGINVGDFGEHERQFSLEGSIGKESLALFVVVPGSGDAAMLQDPASALPTDGFAQELQDRIAAAVAAWSVERPTLGIRLDRSWRRLSDLVQESEAAAVRASVLTEPPELNLTALRSFDSGVQLVAGATPSLEPSPGYAASFLLFDPEKGHLVGAFNTPLLAGTSLNASADIAARALAEQGIKICDVVVAPRAAVVRRLSPTSFLQPCPDGKYRSPQLLVAGNAAWRLRSLDWEAGWQLGGPRFDNDDAVRELSALPHPVALILAGAADALAEHYEPDLLSEVKEQLATPGRLEAVAAGQLRLKDPRLHGLMELEHTHGDEYEDFDALVPPAGMYAALHWKAAKGALLIARAGLIARMQATDIERGFPLRYLRLPYADVYMHFGVPISRNHSDGRVFQITGFYASEEDAQAIGYGDPSVKRLMTITFSYRYQGEAVRAGALVVPFTIKEDDARELSDVITEYNGRMRAATVNQGGAEEDQDDAYFANETVLLAAKLLLYLTLKAARTEEVKTRTQLIEKVRVAKGAVKAALQSQVARTFDYIMVGPEDTPEVAQFAGLSGRKVRPHWRIGFLRDQPCGEGLRERRPVWIQPTLVNANQLSGEAPPKKIYVLE
jgi:hypothetical protein